MRIQVPDITIAISLVFLLFLFCSCSKSQNHPEGGTSSKIDKTDSGEQVRDLQYAGSWYEGNPIRLKQEIDNYLAHAQTLPDKESASRLKVESKPVTGEVLAIIAPHAGFAFSGPTAAFAYKAARDGKIKRVFLLGPSHHVGFEGIALPEASAFATPFGNLAVDTETVAALKSQPFSSVNAEGHKVEHSLEMHLPFIKYCFGDVKLVPLMVGQLKDVGEARKIAAVLKGFIGKGDLIVVSSDFTHYGPRYDYTPFGVGDSVPGKIADMDGEACRLLRDVNLDQFAAFLKKSNDTICGMYPIEVLLGMLPQGAHGTLLKYATSRDSAVDDRDNSVSYLAIAFSGGEWPAAKEGASAAEKSVVKFTAEERQALMNLAKGTIDVYVREKRTASPEELKVKITDTMKQPFGVFVTIKKKAAGAQEHDDLRGCIGSILPNAPLFKGVQENAIACCSRDPRFSPVAIDELKDLEYELSVLSPPKRVGSYKDIVVGRDGVILSKGFYQAVFLPQVAVEWHWGINEMLSQLAMKAGMNADDWKDGASFDVFQAEIIK